MSYLTRSYLYLMDIERRVVVTALALMLVVLFSLSCFLGYVIWQERASAKGLDETLAADPAAAQLAAMQPAGDVLARIRSRGRIIVGVAPDYPPFAYTDANFQLTGLDIDIAKEIGRRLGYPVEFSQISLTGLVDALNLGQVDMAMGGLSITAERMAVVDFSNPYYTGVGAVIAPAHSGLVVNDPTDLAQVRLGVEKGSVFESWARATLVEPGLMPPEYLISKGSLEGLINGLTEAVPSIDAVLLDSSTATAVIQGRPLKLVATGVNQMGYAIAVQKGNPEFVALLNGQLTAMQSDGTLASMIAASMGPPVVVVPPTAVPTPAPVVTRPPMVVPPIAELPPAGAPPSSCLDGLELLADLNYPAADMSSPAQVAPGENIQKGWRVRNVGTCTWGKDYTLLPVSSLPQGSAVTGAPQPLANPVPPGATSDLYVTVLAPAQPGRYRSEWSLASPTGLRFGDRLWAGFEVSSTLPAAPASLPQTTPAANNVQANSVVTIFDAEPASLAQGACLTLTWRYDASGVTQAHLFRSQTELLASAPPAGVLIDCPATPGRFEYRLAIEGDTPASALQVVDVYPPQSTGEAPPAAGAPQISAFTVDHAEIVWGRCVNLSWAYAGAAVTTAELHRGDELIAYELPADGQAHDCPPNRGEYVYRLTIASPNTAPQSATQTVHVRLTP